MKKSDELKLNIQDLRKQVQEAQAAGDIDKATALAKQLQDATKEYNIVAALEGSEVQNFISSGAHPVTTATDKAEEKKVKNRAFNRLILDNIFRFGKPSDQEKAFYDTFGKMRVVDTVGTGQNGAVSADGGYLVPTEQFQQILEFRRVYQELKQYCTVRAAASRKGSQPTVGYEDGVLTAFEELNEINQDKLDFGQILYATADYGDIIPVARELLQDIDVDLMGLIGQRFAKKAVNTENTKILALIKSTLTMPTTPGTDWKVLTAALDKTLDPAISLGASIFTNQDGYHYLNDLVDSQGRPLLNASLADPRVYTFKGRPLIVLKDSWLATDTTTASGYDLYPFYVGMMSEFMYFWDRVGVEVAASDQAGFTKNAILVRAIERFGLTVFDSAALAPCQIKIANT